MAKQVHLRCILNKLCKAENVQNQGIELTLGYRNTFGKIGVASTLTYTLNQNRIKELSKASVNSDGIPEIQKAYLGASSVAPQVILREGGTMSDIYIKHELKRDPNGNIAIDPSSGNLSMQETGLRKAGRLAPNYNMGWNNSISYQGLTLGFVVFCTCWWIGLLGNTGYFRLLWRLSSLCRCTQQWRCSY